MKQVEYFFLLKKKKRKKVKIHIVRFISCSSCRISKCSVKQISRCRNSAGIGTRSLIFGVRLISRWVRRASADSIVNLSLPYFPAPPLSSTAKNTITQSVHAIALIFRKTKATVSSAGISLLARGEVRGGGGGGTQEEPVVGSQRPTSHVSSKKIRPVGAVKFLLWRTSSSNEHTGGKKEVTTAL